MLIGESAHRRETRQLSTNKQGTAISGDSRMKKVGGHCGAKEKSRGGNINVEYCWPKVICCVGQSSEHKREIKQKTGGASGGASQKSGGPWPPLRVTTDRDTYKCATCTAQITQLHTA